MFLAGHLPYLRLVETTRHIVAVGAVLVSMGSIVAAAPPKKKIAGEQPKAPRSDVVTTASKIEQTGSLAYGDQQLSPSVAGNALESEVHQLKRERDSLTNVRSAPIQEPDGQSESIAQQRDKLKQQLNGLMTELSRRPKAEEPSEVSGAKGAAKTSPQQRGEPSKRGRTPNSPANGRKPADVSKAIATQGPVDPMALAQALFRTGDYAGSLKAFDLAKKTVTDPRDRVVIKYFSAVCLSKLGNSQDSATLFREVANSKADDLLAECARWQLSAQQWRESTAARIGQLRAGQTVGKTEARGRTGALEPTKMTGLVGSIEVSVPGES